MSGHRGVEVLEVDPDLAIGLPAAELEVATRKSAAPVYGWAAGTWHPGPENFERAGHLGLLVIDGLLTRAVTIGERTCAELLGPGDILRPWLTRGPNDSVLEEVDWTVVYDVRAASLDAQFAARMSRWPQVIAHVGDRIMMRARSLAFHLAVCHMVRVDERLLLTLWHFADRWGRVTPEGVVIPLRLTHTLLSMVVGARRPSVTKALGNLHAEALVRRRDDGTWLLLGGPPEALERTRRGTTAPIEAAAS